MVLFILLETTLMQLGVKLVKASRNWATHTSAAVNKHHQQQIAKESEKQQQHKLEE